MGSDTIWIFSLVGILMMMGLLLPIMDEVLVLSEPLNMDWNQSAFLPQAETTKLNDTMEADGGLLAATKVDPYLIIKGIGTAFFWSWGWMWNTGLFGKILGTIHILMRFMLVLLLYRQGRSGGG